MIKTEVITTNTPLLCIECGERLTGKMCRIKFFNPGFENNILVCRKCLQELYNELTFFMLAEVGLYNREEDENAKKEN